MHIVVGHLTAKYSGRGETELPPYDRIVIHKADGTVSVHSDKGFKPLNYMAASTPLEVGEDEDGYLTWTFKSKKECLVVTFLEVYNEINLPLGETDPGHSSKQGSEAQLQEWLSVHLNSLDSTLSFLQREFQTGAGPVDLLAEDDKGGLVTVEVKRTATMTTIGQVLRYSDALIDARPGQRVRPCIAAVNFQGKALELAAKKEVLCIHVPPNWLSLFQEEKAAEPVEVRPSLFD